MTREDVVRKNIFFGKGKLKWRVLDVVDKKKICGRWFTKVRVLIITENIIEQMPYNTDANTPVTWKTSSIRDYLNKDFCKWWQCLRFTAAERRKIARTFVNNHRNWKDGTKGGGWFHMPDKVFLLSVEDINTTSLFEGQADRVAEKLEDGAGAWWLRTLGKSDNTKEKIAAMVSITGRVESDTIGTEIPDKEPIYDIVTKDNGVRPALWLKVKSIDELLTLYNLTERTDPRHD